MRVRLMVRLVNDPSSRTDTDSPCQPMAMARLGYDIGTNCNQVMLRYWLVGFPGSLPNSWQSGGIQDVAQFHRRDLMNICYLHG